jgi:Domain of unknown function (DUF4337)
MSHGPEHQIEHAEHAAHASHDEFNKRVTMSIAIVAAVLACVSMLGHRAHNETLLLQGKALQYQGEALRLQGEALQLQTAAGMESTNAAKHWQYYQTKNLFHLESKITIDLLKVVALNEANKDALKEIRKEYQGNVDKYDKKLPQMVEEGKEIEKKADELRAKSKEKLTEYQAKMSEAETVEKDIHLMHARGNRFDYGELGLQFGVVLCSLAILTKGRGLWIVGGVAAVVGAAIAATGQFDLFLGGHH